MSKDTKLTEVTYEHLTVTPFTLVNLEELKITKEINEHGKLFFTGKVPEEVKDDYINLASFGTLIQVIQSKDGDSKTLFSGIISGIRVETEGELYRLTVNAITHTYLLDTQIKRRSFQENGMMYSTMVKKITAEYGGDLLYMPEDEPLKEFIIQYKETDWEFIKRMASRFNEGLYASFTDTVPKYFFGTPKIDGGVGLDDYVFTVEKRLSDYKFLSSNYISDVSNLDFVSYEVETFKQLELGETVVYKNISLCVQSVHMYLEDGVLFNRYHLSSRKGLKQKRFENKQLQGTAVFGHVLDIQRDQVKVHIHEIDQSQDIGKAHWFPYSAMYASGDGSGWYCMPEKGDDVRIEFPNTHDGAAFAVSSISKYDPKTPDKKQDRMGDWQVRYIRNPQGMEVTLTPEQVIISANGTGIIIMDQIGNISIHANKELAFKSDKDVTITAGDTINVMASTNINIKCGDKAEITMNDAGITEVKGNEVYTN